MGGMASGLASIAEGIEEATIPHDEFIKELKQDGIP